VRIEGLRDYGAALSPFNAFQIIQGLETLPIQKHSENGLALAEWLNTRSGGMGKFGLKSSKYYDLAKEYLPKGQNGIVTLV
jgi:O-acetylhomoserine (thiol)-lyase